MKICLISDTHLGITTDGQIEVMLKAAALEEPDVLVHAGDYSGGLEAYKKVTATVKLIRKHFPTTRFLTVIGNHDFWFKGRKNKREVDDFFPPSTSFGRPSAAQFMRNLEAVEKCFEDNNVIFLDKTNFSWLDQDDNFIHFIGSSGWYQNPNPPTNDEKWLPIGLEGDTNRYLLNRAERILGQNIDELSKVYLPHHKVIFVSHFPVINVGRDYKGAFEEFSWRASIGEFMAKEFECKHFLNGHAHQLHKGPLRYECGSDYRYPKYMIIEV